MKLDIDCMRDVLIYLEENLSCSEDRNNHVTFNYISVLKISNDLSDKYDKITVWYSIRMLSECGYIISNTCAEVANSLAFADVKCLTYQGHKFIETIRPQPVWSKTKSVISTVGSHALSFVEDVAKEVAIESSKQAITILLTTQPSQ